MDQPKFVSIFKTLIILISLTFAACAANDPVSKKINLDELSQDVQKKSQLVKQFCVEFTKVKRNTFFNKDLNVNGKLLFQKPNNFYMILSGDINVEILSNGKLISVIHDGLEQEVFRVHGYRDLSKFSDPLMMLLQYIGNGGLRKFSILKHVQLANSIVLELEPGNNHEFERIKNIMIWFSDLGQIEKIMILFKDGNQDETVFKSWSMLTGDDPSILQLNSRLQQLSKIPESGPHQYLLHPENQIRPRFGQDQSYSAISLQ